jgi:hypothetical protein
MVHVLDRTRTLTATELAGFMASAGFVDVCAKRPPLLAGSVVMLGAVRMPS